MNPLCSKLAILFRPACPVPKEHTAKSELATTSPFEAHMRKANMIASLDGASVHLGHCSRRILPRRQLSVFVERRDVMFQLLCCALWGRAVQSSGSELRGNGLCGARGTKIMALLVSTGRSGADLNASMAASSLV